MVHVLAIVMLLVFPGVAAAQTADELALRARALTQSLPEKLREASAWSFEDAERQEVRFAPFRLDGVRHDALGDDARGLADELLAVTLSRAGFEKLQAIRLLERDVRRIDRERLLGLLASWMRDPGRYLWAFFGEPGNEKPWAFRLEGHHLSLNVTLVPGHVPSSTPLFLGAQPRVVPDGWPSAGVATLGEEERLARALYASLTPLQRAIATGPYSDGHGRMVGEVSRIESPDPLGLARSDMTPTQQTQLDAFLDQFASFWGQEIAAARRAEIASAREELSFVHVELDDPPHGFYTRVGGPDLLIEIDNTGDGDHVHAVWHNPGSDFGENLLARHLRHHHAVTSVELAPSAAGGDNARSASDRRLTSPRSEPGKAESDEQRGRRFGYHEREARGIETQLGDVLVADLGVHLHSSEGVDAARVVGIADRSRAVAK